MAQNLISNLFDVLGIQSLTFLFCFHFDYKFFLFLFWIWDNARYIKYKVCLWFLFKKTQLYAVLFLNIPKFEGMKAFFCILSCRIRVRTQFDLEFGTKTYKNIYNFLKPLLGKKYNHFFCSTLILSGQNGSFKPWYRRLLCFIKRKMNEFAAFAYL